MSRLIADHLALRAVIYNDRRGGYIDNVPGTFTRKDTDLGIYYANNPGGGVPCGRAGHQQQRDCRPGHQSCHVHRHSLRTAVPDQ